jgi:RNA-directed DNA polymerase
MTLLDQVSSYENLTKAYTECSRGKKKSFGFYSSRFNLNEKFVLLRDQLGHNTFCWSSYRSFYVQDPKKRLIMAAPFMDRVVHHSIHRVIEPILEPKLSTSVFACRKDKGNKNAASALFHFLKNRGSHRYALKIDISQYFQSIHHEYLLNQIMANLPDNTLMPLILKLLNSHEEYQRRGIGIPIGNLTSQLFANFYLKEADNIAIKKLGFSYFHPNMQNVTDDHLYLRYMDDFILVSKNKKNVCEAAQELIVFCEKNLQLKIPVRKRMHFGSDPIPFLGYLIDHTFLVPLAKNKRKIKKKLRLMKKNQKPPSQIAQVKLSYEAWSSFKERAPRVKV